MNDFRIYFKKKSPEVMGFDDIEVEVFAANMNDALDNAWAAVLEANSNGKEIYVCYKMEEDFV